MFNHKRHNLIVEILQSSDAGQFEASHCFFAGGTAATLLNGEYRLSNDIDFLCDAQSGYRDLRAMANSSHGMKEFFPIVEPIRDCRIDQYGIRQFVEFGGEQFKIEIVREGNVKPLSGMTHAMFGVPVLDVVPLTATKLTANADRWRDLGVGSRDIVDLAFIALTNKGLPDRGVILAAEAYGMDQIAKPLVLAAEQALEPLKLDEICAKLAIETSDKDRLKDGLSLLLEANL